ncbi:MAG: carboxymuconolactone decarboxylase family protein [Gammaproteobacteria bacterium]|nr:MAG: carboxymuconolactone decarboxylase family protein [Gammaproteobacteria bacterium]
MTPDTPLNRVPREQLPPDMQRAWDASMALHGDTTFVEVAGNHPTMWQWYREAFYQQVFYSGRLERRLVELVRLRLANVHGCAFCNRADTAAALEAGVPQAQIDALDDYENGPFSDAEKSALALADEMALTNPRGMLDRALYARCRVHFSDAQLFELGMIMAVLCGMAKFIFAFDLVEKMPSCPFLPAGAGQASGV